MEVSFEGRTRVEFADGGEEGEKRIVTGEECPGLGLAIGLMGMAPPHEKRASLR